MGCLFVIVLGGMTAAMVYFFGYHDWVLIVMGALWLVSLVFSLLRGHVGFGGHGNTDLQIVLAGMFIAAAIILPDYAAHQPCNQARTALRQLATAEEAYFAEHKAYAATLGLLKLVPNPEVQLILTGANEQSFSATASHLACVNEKDGSPAMQRWDSTKGGLQQ